MFFDKFCVARMFFRSIYNHIPLKYREITRFLIIGGSLTLGWTILATLLKEYTLFSLETISVLAYACMITIGYFSQRIITFRANNSHIQAFPRYVSVQMIGLLLATFFSRVVMGNFQLGERLGLGVLGTFIGFGCVGGTTAALNFILLKYWTFRRLKKH